MLEYRYFNYYLTPVFAEFEDWPEWNCGCRTIFYMKTPADLGNLLLWLGPNSEAGAHRYIEVRQKLAALFRFRGSSAPDELADQTLDRTAQAILRPGFVFQGDPMAYLRGVARNVYLESLRKNRVDGRDVSHEVDSVPQPALDNSGIEPLFQCLDRCLAMLDEEKRTLLLRYYQGERSAKIDGRLQLARERGMELNALRIQVFRLRNVVRRCVERCSDSREIVQLS
jgi:DNA-directed RNA polymerase specialized sigma24 family protein